MLNKKYTFKICCLVLAGLALSLNLYAADIAIFGDSQHDDTAKRRIVLDVKQHNPVAVFRVGDLVENGNDPELWRRFNLINKPLLESVKYYPALGNHENDSPLYFKNFPFLKNRRWYSVDCEGAHFIILDSNSALAPGSVQYTWLVKDLKGIKNNSKFRIAIFHHPMFSVGGHHDDEKHIRNILLPLFRQYGVSAVFSGHDHNYQRLDYQGISFIVTGGGGSYLRDKTRESPYLKKYAKAYHFCLLSPDADAIKVRVLDIDNCLIDEFVIPKTGAKTP